MTRGAVIDIGSNSVRLVIYRRVRSAALPHFNEKVLAGLGRGLSDTGKLSEDGKIAALSALERYSAILTALKVSDVFPVATAAVREAKDGPDFAAVAEEILGYPVRVLSGKDEAKLSSLGVISGTFDATGVCGDLGGSSLEFSQLSNGTVGDGETHLVGPLSMSGTEKLADRRKALRAAIETSDIVRQAEGGVFYAVGGAWRAIAKLYITTQEYPLSTLHGFRISARDISQFARHLMVGSPVMRARIKEVTGRSPSNVIHAAAVLEQVFDIGRFEQLFVSANGVREGVLAEAQFMTDGDPLIDGVAASAHLDDAQYAFGDALHKFVRPALAEDGDLFGPTHTQSRIDRAACMLADSGARLHPDHRADLAYDLALRGAFTGATHAQRAFIAMAVGCRYYKSFRRPKKDWVLMSQTRADRARQLGSLMRLGAVFSGRSAPILERASLRRRHGKLVLSVEQASASMVSEAVRKRLSQAARHLLLKPEIKIG